MKGRVGEEKGRIGEGSPEDPRIRRRVGEGDQSMEKDSDWRMVG